MYISSTGHLTLLAHFLMTSTSSLIQVHFFHTKSYSDNSAKKGKIVQSTGSCVGKYISSDTVYHIVRFSIMTSSNGNIFRVTSSLCGEFTGRRWIPLTKGNQPGALMFSLTCAWTNGWTNNWDPIDLRRHRAHYDVTVMIKVMDFHLQFCYVYNLVKSSDFLLSRRPPSYSTFEKIMCFVCIVSSHSDYENAIFPTWLT